ncbi:dimethylsulfonioproprionate lyase family protein [Hwanghaeella sp.]|uniref:dimethylsulfonioproprionate lyase family protein n=1 Tax=Hwanghaeella sp. TaxID=2605943 RepID=UPI003CCB8B65
MIPTIENVLDHSWREVEARVDAVTGTRIRRPETVPKDVPLRTGRVGTDFPVLRHLPHALEAAAAWNLAGLADSFGALAGAIEWSQNSGYTEENSSRAFLDGYAYASFSGPDGPIVCEAPMAGFMLLGPNVHYPDHRHEPREVYLVLTSGVQWTLDSGEWFDVAPGTMIVHDRWQKHAIRTRNTPFLAFAAWMEAGPRNGIEWA